MQDFVSTRWLRMVGLVGSITIAWAIFVPGGIPWTAWMGLFGVSLAISGALWLRITSPRSIWQVIDDVEAEPVRVVAGPPPASVTVPKAGLLKGDKR